jgi:hypothetical protein
MKERPIIFSAPMIKALLDGRKTQTRRIIKPQPEVNDQGNLCGDWLSKPLGGLLVPKLQDIVIHCPFGEIGDVLWVRETWQIADWTEEGDPFVRYKSTGDVINRGQHVSEGDLERVEEMWAELSGRDNYLIDNKAADRKWRSPIFMPKWASRITLEITNIRVERLNDISEEDAIAEGVTQYVVDTPTGKLANKVIDDYMEIWESINGKGSRDINPFVWVIEFRRI